MSTALDEQRALREEAGRMRASLREALDAFMVEARIVRETHASLALTSAALALAAASPIRLPLGG